MKPVYPFSPKHTANVDLHFMSGITLIPWLTCVCKYFRAIEWKTYSHRVSANEALVGG